MTAPNVNGPELLDYTFSDLQDIYVRLYAAIASAPINDDNLSDGRSAVIQSLLDLINPSEPLPTTRLVDAISAVMTK